MGPCAEEEWNHARLRTRSRCGWGPGSRCGLALETGIGEGLLGNIRGNIKESVRCPGKVKRGRHFRSCGEVGIQTGGRSPGLGHTRDPGLGKLSEALSEECLIHHKAMVPQLGGVPV